MQPSQDYYDLIDSYKKLHEQEGKFKGISLIPLVPTLMSLVKENNCKTLLDYGCGKAVLYTDKFSEITDEIDCPLPEYWELDECELFDPGYEKHSKLPIHRKDAVICTDVLEHVAEEDLGWVVEEIFSYAKKIVFLNVACFEALKILPDGRNAHISVFSPNDWIQMLAEKSRKFKHLKIYLFADTMKEQDTKTFLAEGYRIDQYPRVVKLKKEEEQ